MSAESGLWVRLSRALGLSDSQTHLESHRWVVVDVETTGTDPRRDELLCVAALAIEWTPQGPQLRVSDSFEAVLLHEQPRAAHDNVLLHGIGWGQQRQGRPATQVLPELLKWLDGAPLLAYHAGFDRAVLHQACKRHRLPDLQGPWLDLADLLPVAYPHCKAASLDEWMKQLGVSCARRHQAAADVWATAELFLKAWPLWRDQGMVSWQDFMRKAEQQRWLRVSASSTRL